MQKKKVVNILEDDFATFFFVSSVGFVFFFGSGDVTFSVPAITFAALSSHLLAGPDLFAQQFLNEILIA
jgi:hypothetical protein